MPPDRFSSSLHLYRLKHDISEFLAEPYPGVEIFFQDENYDKICLHLTPQSGPMVGLRFHFDFELPEDWPRSPPSVRCSYPGGLPHPNVYGDFICCDILTNYENNRAFAGYTPAFTLRAVCMQLLSFFSSSQVEQDTGHTVVLGEELISHYFPASRLQSNIDYIRTRLGRFRIDTRESDWETWRKQFLDALQSPEAQIEKEFIQLKAPNSSDSHPQVDEPGSWTGWKQLEAPPHELEITKIAGTDAVRIQYRNLYWNRSYDDIRSWGGCDTCKYNREGGPKPIEDGLMSTLKELSAKADETARHPQTETQPIQSQDLSVSKKCYIETLPIDLFLQLADYLPTESMNALASALPYFKNIIEQFHVRLYRDLQCFVLRKTLNSDTIKSPQEKTILGVGVGIMRQGFVSSFDWLSLEAFEVYEIRQGIDKTPYEFFLPLVFSKVHFERARDIIWRCINQMGAQLQPKYGYSVSKLKEPTKYQDFPSTPDAKSMHVIYKLMNDIVVELMKAWDEAVLPASGRRSRSSKNNLLQASEKSIVAYCQLFYLIICFAKTSPSIRAEALKVLTEFTLSSEKRSKKVIPHMGHFIVQLCLVNGSVDESSPDPEFHKGIDWEKEIVGPFIQEVLARNVNWVLKANVFLGSHENDFTEAEVDETFQHSRTSNRLIMFQTFFLRFVVRNHQRDPSHLENNFGFPPEEAAETVVKEIKKIYKVDTWSEYFSYIGYEEGARWDKATIGEKLRGSWAESLQKEYHGQPKKSRAKK
ncbi:hypothetical protein TWF694_011370 [Orbilia ellipsospora]|uniref:UBC core domain-containing protein n=1 Tax=Orbilia ellipsospora TaxID=2528407 RepID=A0AAV9X521_9PEZI